MKQENEIVTKPGSEISVVDLDINSVKIAELSVRCTNLPVNLKDDEIYRQTQDIINEARTMRGQIKTAGTGLKEDAAKWQKKVVAEEKRLDGEITAFLEPLAARKKVHDDEVKAEKERKRKVEQARKDAHLANINNIRLLIGKAQNQPSSVIEQVIAELEGMAVEGFYKSFEEYEDEAGGVYDDTELALNSLLIAAQNVEEADRQRKIEDERLKKEREALAAEAAENERIRKENERVKKENDRQAAELEEKAAEPAQEEQAAVDSSAAEDVTEQPAAEPTKVQKKISNEQYAIEQAKLNAITAISEVLSQHDYASPSEDAQRLFDAICSGKIPGVSYSMF